MRTTYTKEFWKTLQTTLLLFTLCVAYCILRNLKDAVTLTGTTAGAEIIPFLKVWGMLPASIIILSLFTWLSRHLKRESLFYIIIISFLSYFVVFALLINPNIEFLKLNHLGKTLSNWLPVGMHGLVQMIENWPVSTFYIMSEMWATTIINVLFWGYLNEITSTDEAKNTFGKIKIGATISAFVGGYLASILTFQTYDDSFPLGNTLWEQTLNRQTLAVLVLGIISMLLFKQVSQRTSFKRQIHENKVRISLLKSIKFVARSRYLTSICLMVVGYNLVFNLSDLLWKQQVSLAYRDPNQMLTYMSNIMMVVGIISVIATLLSSTIVRQLGWTALGQITPVAMLLASVAFFSALLFGKEILTLIPLFHVAPIGFLLTIGAMQNCLSKACKYSVFDVSKELALTPLDPDTKWNGKTAIDGIGNDLGKTGSSLLHQGFLILFGNITLSAPYVALSVITMLLVWINAANYIGKVFHKETDKAFVEIHS